MIQNTLSFKTTFLLANDTPTIKIQDISPYVAEGIALTDVNIVFKIISPIGIIYNNTNFSAPDISYPNIGIQSDIFSSVLLPFTSAGEVIQGNYTIVMTLQVGGIVQAGTYTLTKIYNYSLVFPVVEINTDIDCLCGKLKSIDDTSYGILGTADNIPVFDIDLVTNSFIFEGDQSGLFLTDNNITIGGSTGNNGIYKIISSSVVTGNTKVIVYDTIQNATVDGYVIGVNLILNHTVNYPASSKHAPVISSLSTVLISPIYTKTWTTMITSIITYTGQDGLNIIFKISGSAEYPVNCDFDMCDIYCCVNKLLQRYVSKLQFNPSEAKKIKEEQLDLVMYDMVLFRSATECGHDERANELINEILKIAQCERGCGCDDNINSSQIIPVCSPGSSGSTIVTAGNGIDVILTINGTIYSYQVSIASALLTKIQNSYNSNIIAGTGMSVTSVINADGSKTFTVNNTATPVYKNTQHLILTTVCDEPNVVTPTITQIVRTGTNMQDAQIAKVGFVTPYMKNNVFRVSNFQVTPNSNYKVWLNLIPISYRAGETLITQDKQYLIMNFFSVEEINKTSGQFDFRICNHYDGFPMTYYRLMSLLANFIVEILINE